MFPRMARRGTPFNFFLISGTLSTSGHENLEGSPSWEAICRVERIFSLPSAMKQATFFRPRPSVLNPAETHILPLKLSVEQDRLTGRILADSSTWESEAFHSSSSSIGVMPV